jgi:predicted SAM-dependent methyltransferase
MNKSDAVDKKCDVRHMPEIRSNTADAVAAIHLLEHFYPWQVLDILSEWRRILKPGGKLILELPCLDKIMDYIASAVNQNIQMDANFAIYHPLYGDPKHRSAEQMHKWGWFVENLTAVLKTVGFRNIQSVPPRYHFAFRDMRLEATK